MKKTNTKLCAVGAWSWAMDDNRTQCRHKWNLNIFESSASRCEWFTHSIIYKMCVCVCPKYAFKAIGKQWKRIRAQGLRKYCRHKRVETDTRTWRITSQLHGAFGRKRFSLFVGSFFYIALLVQTVILRASEIHTYVSRSYSSHFFHDVFAMDREDSVKNTKPFELLPIRLDRKPIQLTACKLCRPPDRNTLPINYYRQRTAFPSIH